VAKTLPVHETEVIPVLCVRSSGSSSARSSATTTFDEALRSSTASSIRVGRGIVGSQEIRSGVCRCLLAPTKYPFPLPNPLISPVTTQQYRFAAYLSLIPDRGAADHLH
jgi:hypothetical protein